MRQAVRVEGLRELQRALRAADAELARELNRELRRAADIVAQDARGRFAQYDARSAAGFRGRVKGGGRAVAEQRRRRTTGQHPEYGALQMTRALLPALAAKRPQVERSVEQMLDGVLRRTL